MAIIRVRERSDGTTAYTLQYRLNGKQPTVTFDDYGTALIWKQRFQKLGAETALEMLAAENRITGTDMVTLEKAGEEYITDLTGVEDGTRNRYRAFMRNDINPFFGKILPPIAITESLIRKWINHLQKKVKNSAKTIANKHGFLFGLMEHLRKKGIIPKNPCEGTKLPRVEIAEMTFLEPEEFAALHAAIPERWKLFVSFLVASGVRWGEITALRVGDIDRNRCTVRIRRAWKYTGGKRVLGEPKTKKSRRTLNLDPDLVAQLPLKGRVYGDWLFVNDQGGPIQISTFYKQIWVPTLEALAADPADPLNGKTPRIHDLRHTCASWMLDENVPITDVQDHLGHESIKTTKDRYGHRSREAGRRAAAAVGKRLPKSGPKPQPTLALAAAA